MRYILIPIKDLARAKQRLGGLMSQQERTRLAMAMCENTLAAAASARRADRTAIVTLYPPAIALAEKYGLEVILESEQISESASVDFGSRGVIARGASAVLRLPIDLPLVTGPDIDAVLDSQQDETQVVMVPSRDGTGTNAILRSPPDLFPSHFGPHSFSKHLEEATRLGAPYEIVYSDNIALDLDDLDDLAFFIQKKCRNTVHALLMEMNLPERLTTAISNARR